MSTDTPLPVERAARRNFDTLGTDMKQYEVVCRQHLMPGMPYVLRLDGDSFHKVTELLNVERPFSDRFAAAMIHTANCVMKYLAGAVCAYVQSDEISIIVLPSPTGAHEHLAGRTDKLNSLAASLATVEFLGWFSENEKALLRGRPLFDSRCFSLPEAELSYYLTWRQLDAWKNCVGSATHYALGGGAAATRQLRGVSVKERQAIYTEKTGKLALDLPAMHRRGVVLRKGAVDAPADPENPRSVGCQRKVALMDANPPIFTKDTDYVTKLLSRAALPVINIGKMTAASVEPQQHPYYTPPGVGEVCVYVEETLQ